ncbi:hypothetical protein JCM8547_004455 [Rhodosporidiobolus lusitaniae]
MPYIRRGNSEHWISQAEYEQRYVPRPHEMVSPILEGERDSRREPSPPGREPSVRVHNPAAINHYWHGHNDSYVNRAQPQQLRRLTINEVEDAGPPHEGLNFHGTSNERTLRTPNSAEASAVSPLDIGRYFPPRDDPPPIRRSPVVLRSQEPRYPSSSENDSEEEQRPPVVNLAAQGIRRNRNGARRDQWRGSRR